MPIGTDPENGFHDSRSSPKESYRTMKTKTMISMLAMGVLALSAGCGKNDKSAQPAAANAPAPSSDAALEETKSTEVARTAELEKAAARAKAAAAQLKAEAEKSAAKLAESEKVATAAVADAKAAAQKLQAKAEQTVAAKAVEANAATETLTQKALSAIQQPGQIESLIASAKNLTGQNKYAEALKIVAELAKLKLSPEQQAMVDQVKQVAEQQMAKALAA